MTEFQCFRRLGKVELFGTVLIEPHQLVFTCLTDPSATATYSLSLYAAQRQHPKLPMIQLRFSQPGGQPEDLTFVFKDRSTGLSNFDLLKAFLTSFNGIFQAVRATLFPETHAGDGVPLSSTTTPTIPPTTQPLISSVEITTLPLQTQITDQLPLVKTSSPLAKSVTDTRRLSLHSKPVSLTPGVLQQLQQERYQLLEQDEELKGAYDYLVSGGFLSDAQFWEQHDEEFLALQSQPSGLFSDDRFLSVPPPQQPQETILSSDAKKVHGKASVPKVTQHQLDQITFEHPPIRELYIQTVPIKVSNEEFWTRFFQSRYYYQMTGRTPPPGADEAIFPDFDPDLLVMIPTAPEVQQIVTPSVDLVAADQFNKPGFGSILGQCSLVGENSKASSKSQRRSLLERFNRHSFNIMNEIQSKPGRNLNYKHHRGQRSHNDFQDWHQKRQQSLLDDTILEDLKESKTSDIPVLQLNGVTTFTPSCTTEAGIAAKNSLVERLRSWTPPNPSMVGLPPEEAKFMFMLNTKLIQKEIQKQDNYKIKDLLQNEQIAQLLHRVAVHQSRLRELFQHFWQSGIFQRDKQERLATAIRNTIVEINDVMTQFKSFTDRQTSTINARALYQPLLEASKTALDRYETLKLSSNKNLPGGLKRSASTAGWSQERPTLEL